MLKSCNYTFFFFFFYILDTAFNYERESTILLFLQDFSKNNAFLLCGAERRGLRKRLTTSKLQRMFLTCLCHYIYMLKAVGRIKANYTLKKKIFVNVKFGASCLKNDNNYLI